MTKAIEIYEIGKDISKEEVFLRMFGMTERELTRCNYIDGDYACDSMATVALGKPIVGYLCHGCSERPVFRRFKYRMAVNVGKNIP